MNMTWEEISKNRQSFVTTYLPIAGWKAVLYWWNEEDGGFWEPWNTSHFAYKTEDEAEIYAKKWAEAEDIPYIRGKG